MEGNVTLPGIGSVDKKKALLVGGAVVIVGVAYYRHKQAAGSSGTTSLPANPTDPATGYPQGSPEDLNALALQGTDPTGSGGGGGGSGGIVDTNGTNVPNQTTSFVDNAHWEQSAIAYLSGLGESPTAVSAALGKYLAGTPVTPSERSYIDQAIASQNQPPIAGAAGYPPFVHMVPASTKPPVTSTRLHAPAVHTVSHTSKLWRLGWGHVADAAQYNIHDSHGLVGITRSTTYDLHKNGSYTVYAVPSPADKKHTYSPPSNSVHVSGVK